MIPRKSCLYLDPSRAQKSFLFASSMSTWESSPYKRTQNGRSSRLRRSWRWVYYVALTHILQRFCTCRGLPTAANLCQFACLLGYPPV
ncbi:hypothetical protein CPC08DRAFT_72758 [Agrocybe pediades]|nr:hypothetical protein CPC08DRAFT_72758 [Agrocybe pediades]